MLEKSPPPAVEGIRAALRATGRSQKDVAEALGIKPQAITGWLKTGRISKESLSGLAAMSGMSSDAILGLRQEKLSPLQRIAEESAPVYLPDRSETQSPQASHSVRLDPATIAAATRVLQIVFGRRGVTVNLAERDFAELFAVAYEALAEMADEPDAELLLTAQVIDLIAEREARRGKESEPDGGVDRAPARKKTAR